MSVPKIEGLTKSKAESKLADKKNLEIGAVTYIHHDTIEEGIIISQNVKEDEQVKEDYEIDVVISLGKKNYIL